MRWQASVLFALLMSVPAHAAGKLKAEYTLTVARIPVGAATLESDIADEAYISAMTGHASAVLQVFASGKGALNARGALAGGQPKPAAFTFDIEADDDRTAKIALAFDAGLAKVTAGERPAQDGRIAVTEDHRRNVLDPLSALMLPAKADASACARTLSIYDGRRRFDLKLAFKRSETIKTKGYEGMAAVCAVTFQAVAGHRPESTAVKFLSDGREIEIWFAPVAGTPLLAPYRVSIAAMLGNIVVQANAFEAVAKAKAP